MLPFYAHNNCATVVLLFMTADTLTTLMGLGTRSQSLKAHRRIFHYSVIHKVSFSGHTLRNAVFGKKSWIFGMFYT
jgi:hypothetical protein